MAFTPSLLFRGKFGNKIVKGYSYTLTGATTGGNILTGLSKIEISLWTEKIFTAGATLDDTTTAGKVTLASLTATDSGYILVIGR